MEKIFDKRMAEKVIIESLANGVKQGDIPDILISKGIRPNSASYVEKVLRNKKAEYSAKTNIELFVKLAKTKKIK